MSTLIFEVPGYAQPKERARTGRWGGRTPARTAAYERHVAFFAQMAADRARWETIENGEPVELVLTIFVETPKSWTKKKKSEMAGRPCTNTTDLSNIFKAIEDAINHTTIWEDDRQVAIYGRSGMFWAKEPGVVVAIRSASDEMPDDLAVKHYSGNI